MKKTNIKLFRGLLITLADSCSCLIWDSIWLFSRICFSFPQGSQPFADSAVMVSTCFKRQLHALSLTWHLSSCNTQEQPRHMSSVAACSSAGASASATSSEAGSWQCRYAVKSLVELVEISPTHVTVQESIFTNLQGHIQIFSHVPQKKDCELTESNTIRCSGKNQVRVPSYLASAGPIDPKKTNAFCWKNGKRKISESIYYMPRPQLLLPPLLLHLPLHEGFIMAQSHVKAAQKKVSKSSFSTTSANICNLCFSTYPARPIMTWEAPPSSYVYVCFTQLSPQEPPRHMSSVAACSSAGASASATASEAGSWQWS